MNWNGLIKLGIIVGENIMEKQKIDNERLRQQNEKIARERAAQEASAAASKLQSQRLEETIARESIHGQPHQTRFNGFLHFLRYRHKGQQRGQGILRDAGEGYCRTGSCKSAARSRFGDA